MSTKPEAFERFEKFARAIVRVPKREVDAIRAKAERKKIGSGKRRPRSTAK